MGVRGELFSTKMSSDKRTYFFNVKEDRVGAVFLTIVESKKDESAGFDRHQIMVYEEEIEGFLREFTKAASVLQKHKQVTRGAPARRHAPAGHHPSPTASTEAPRPRKPPRTEPVPTYALDGEWKGPEVMRARGGKVARIKRADIEARAANVANLASDSED